MLADVFMVHGPEAKEFGPQLRIATCFAGCFIMRTAFWSFLVQAIRGGDMQCLP
jgi:hypothetical protein